MSSSRLPSLSRPVGFWLAATTLLTLMVAAAAPSPLYVVFQARWGFSDAVLGLVFGVYAAALLVTLVTLGGISDRLGRRPVLVTGMVLQTGAMALFLVADGVTGLLVARVVQGVATGLIMGTITAVLIDLQPPDRPQVASTVNGTAPTVGLALGAVGAGLLARSATDPTATVFVLLTALCAALAGTVLLLPDRVGERAGRLRERVRPVRSLLAAARPRLAVPVQARRPFLVAVPAFVASWATGGFYLALAPSVLAGPLHRPDHLLGGALVATLNLAAAVAVQATGRRRPREILVGGAVALAAGTAVTLAAVAATSPVWLFVGTAVAGTGFGTTFIGAFGGLAPLAGADERAELFAAVFTVNYLAFSVPVVVAGAVARRAGLAATATGYGSLVIVLCVLAVVATVVSERRAARAATAPDARIGECRTTPSIVTPSSG